MKAARCLALLAALLMLAGCAAAATPEPTSAPTPEPTTAPTPAPTPEPTPEPTPCPHPAWEDGSCTACGLACSHPSHDAETRQCSTCGELVPHHYISFRCTLCGAEAVFETEQVPRGLFEPCAHAGTVEMLSYTTTDYRPGPYGEAPGPIEKQMAVYLPYGYDPAEKYDLLILLHGIGGSERYWLVNPQDYRYPSEDMVYTANLLDNLIDAAACRPMIVAAPTFYRNSAYPDDYLRALDQPAFTCELREDILPALVEAYSTWADEATPEAIARARDHFAYAGLSQGSIYAYTSVIPECIDLFASFGCFSGSDGSMPRVAETLNSPPESELPIRVFYNSVGNADSFYSLHWNHYYDLTARCDGLTEGENAVFTTLQNLPHTYAAWSLGLYNFLPLLFSMP